MAGYKKEECSEINSNVVFTFPGVVKETNSTYLGLPLYWERMNDHIWKLNVIS